MNRETTERFVEDAFEHSILPTLVDYIRIPNKSPAFDKQWAIAGHMDRAVDLISGWCREQPIEGLTIEVLRLEGRTPLIFMEIPGDGEDTVMLYGHLDKQPEMTGWFDGLGPWEPVLRGDRLYGRGGADDGYAAFAALTAVRALREQGGRHARIVVLIEACEESGSYDLPHYIDALSERIGDVSLVIALDSGCGNYEQMWCTTSLRGLVGGALRVEVLTEGVHSGDASGIVPSSFRIARDLIGRIEDSRTGRIDRAFHAAIPKQRVEQARGSARVLGQRLHRRFPWSGRAKPIAKDLLELVLNRTWRPFLEIVGMSGVPPVEEGGNVMRPFTTLKLSLRLPPTVDPEGATKKLSRLLTKDPPHGASVSFHPDSAAPGWNAPPLAPWLEASCEKASRAHYGKSCVYMGEGGSIPFMGMLGQKFPNAQFVITGVLGPQSNAHGPNEFLHVPMAKRLTCCVAQILEDHCARDRSAAKLSGERSKKRAASHPARKAGSARKAAKKAVKRGAAKK
ncbi:MAG: M20 family metallopeptidase [Planctomycetota bacterium]